MVKDTSTIEGFRKSNSSAVVNDLIGEYTSLMGIKEDRVKSPMADGIKDYGAANSLDGEAINSPADPMKHVDGALHGDSAANGAATNGAVEGEVRRLRIANSNGAH
jgi:hypothetical protein